MNFKWDSSDIYSAKFHRFFEWLITLKIKRSYPLVISFLFISGCFVCYINGVIINVTPSMAEGIYIKSSGKIHVGDVVAFCLEEPYKSFGLSRQYLEKGSRCEGSNPLIKQVIAIPGDNIFLQDKFIQVNDIKYFYQTFYQDSKGRALNVYPRGEYDKTEGYWLIGTHAMNSWDSRYWGDISQQQILYKIKPLFTW